MIAAVIVAATRSRRVAVNDLLAGCHTLSALRDLSAHDLGRLMKDTAWKPAQWRQDGGRVRGYVAPVTAEKPDRTR
ncbi:hypothetical protein AruPA_02645 [Acidiphilium sp. PA]|uniref:hypothetical protein n=1 Tax=Acidiphilium sp. PA TaxID=2871705 RepID=UPI0022437355|nr:hypothetical protein [Acidiphilium sp. PA]MCW8305922.1 hypothetical protein [Acidiphilium sp. PA]